MQKGEASRLQASAVPPPILATFHPSSILRATTEEDRHRQLDTFVADLKKARAYLARQASNPDSTS